MVLSLMRGNSFLLLPWIGLLIGCHSQDEIQTYSVPRTSPPRQSIDIASFERQLDHTLVAILPRGEKAWFFKLTGSAPAVGRHREVFVRFLESVKVGNTEGDTPAWDLPDDWEEKGASAMRTATLVVPDEAGPMEVAVSSLPLADDWENFVVRNVNRWLGQLSQSDLTAETVMQLVEKVETQSGDATLVILAGFAQQPRGRNPHAGIATSTDGREKKAPLQFDTPEGWLPGELREMRKAAFRIVEGDAQAEVTVLDFSDDPNTQMANVAANVRRWAGQLRLGDLDDVTLEELVESIAIDSIDASYVQMIGPEEADHPQAMLVAMLQREEKVWFFKLNGDASLVLGQQENFRGFLASVRFSD